MRDRNRSLTLFDDVTVCMISSNTSFQSPFGLTIRALDCKVKSYLPQLGKQLSYWYLMGQHSLFMAVKNADKAEKGVEKQYRNAFDRNIFLLSNVLMRSFAGGIVEIYHAFGFYPKIPKSEIENIGKKPYLNFLKRYGIPGILNGLIPEMLTSNTTYRDLPKKWLNCALAVPCEVGRNGNSSSYSGYLLVENVRTPGIQAGALKIGTKTKKKNCGDFSKIDCFPVATFRLCNDWTPAQLVENVKDPGNNKKPAGKSGFWTYTLAELVESLMFLGVMRDDDDGEKVYCSDDRLRALLSKDDVPDLLERAKKRMQRIAGDAKGKKKGGGKPKGDDDDGDDDEDDEDDEDDDGGDVTESGADAVKIEGSLFSVMKPMLEKKKTEPNLPVRYEAMCQTFMRLMVGYYASIGDSGLGTDEDGDDGDDFDVKGRLAKVLTEKESALQKALGTFHTSVGQILKVNHKKTAEGMKQLWVERLEARDTDTKKLVGKRQRGDEEDPVHTG